MIYAVPDFSVKGPRTIVMGSRSLRLSEVLGRNVSCISSCASPLLGISTEISVFYTENKPVLLEIIKGFKWIISAQVQASRLLNLSTVSNSK